MQPQRLSKGEYVAMVGGAFLVIGIFLVWYKTNGAGRIDGKQGSFTGWEIHTIIRYPLVLAGLAPFILAYIILRNHKLSWPRGEMTAVIAIIAFGLIAY